MQRGNKTSKMCQNIPITLKKYLMGFTKNIESNDDDDKLDEVSFNTISYLKNTAIVVLLTIFLLLILGK